MSAHDGGRDDDDDILANRRVICRLDARSIPDYLNPSTPQTRIELILPMLYFDLILRLPLLAS